MPDQSLNHKIFVVTGAGSGIGSACVRALLASGAQVIGLDLKIDGRMALSADRLQHYRFVAMDVRDAGTWARLADEIRKQHGHIDGIVNGAGVYRDDNIEDVSLAEFRTVLAVNLEGALLGCKMAVDLMKGHGGSIVNVSSVLAIRPRSAAIAYSVSKAGVNALTRSVAHHCKINDYGIRCNSVCFGTVDTPMSAEALAKSGQDPKTSGVALDNIHGRPATAEEAADAIIFLLSEKSKFMTGASVVVDGGRLL